MKQLLKRLRRLLWSLLIAVYTVHAPAAPDHQAHAAHAKVPTTAAASFDGKGRLWVVSPRDGFIWLRRSDDFGRTFGAEVRLNPTPEKIAADGDNRPKVLVSDAGVIYVSYTSLLEQPYSGDIRLMRSTDGGRTFSAPITVNDNREIISHRFEAMQTDGSGKLWLAWLDKRDLAAAARRHRPYTGAALYAAVSADGGASFQANVKLADHSCECCRVAMAKDVDGTPVVFWRHVFGTNTRDHAMRRLDGTSALVRVSYDNWQVDACPHHGPAISIGPDSTYHFVWFTGAPTHPGPVYRHSNDHGEHFSEPMHFGAENVQAGHPDVLSFGKRVMIVWKEFDGDKTAIHAMQSIDGGETWSAAVTIATTVGASDHPVLVGYRNNAFLSWFTAQEGYRLIPVGVEDRMP